MKRLSDINSWISRESEDFRILIRNVPPVFMSIYVVSIFIMNILANKELLKTDYLVFDCGFSLSWVAFLAMDIMCRHYGPKSAFKVSLVAIFLNLTFSLLLYFISIIPGHWGEFYQTNSLIVDDVINHTIGGMWYIICCSAIAMSISSFVNSSIYYLISKITNRRGFKNFAVRSYVSTAIGQFADNLVFALLVSYVLFGWSWIQILSCSLVSAAFELLCEVFFSPVGYAVCVKWEKIGIGEGYRSSQHLQ